MESYQLSVSHIDRTGAITGEYTNALLAIDSGEDIPLHGPNGRATVRLPKGKYILHSIIDTPANGESTRTLLTQPLLTIDRNTTVTLDARVGKPVELTSPEPSATPLAGEVNFARRLGNGKDYRTSEWAFLRPLKVWTAHLGPPVPAAELSAMTSMVWGPKRTGEPMANPTLYGLAWSQTGKVYTGFRGTVERKRLAEVKLQFGPVRAGHGVSHGVIPIGMNDNEGLGTPVPLKQPASVTMYLGGENTQWSTRFEQNDVSSPGGDSGSWQVSPVKSYQPGRKYLERVNFAVFGPSLPADRAGWVNRRGDELLAGVSDVSSQVSGEWTFRSAYVDASSVVQMPVSVIRFSPKLNDSNAAPAGRPFHVPISTQSQPGAGKIRLGVVEVSYDDGTTWQKVPVVANNALLLHPKKAGFVSLRAKARDSKGNTVDQTIIRAYKLT